MADDQAEHPSFGAHGKSFTTPLLGAEQTGSKATVTRKRSVVDYLKGVQRKKKFMFLGYMLPLFGVVFVGIIVFRLISPYLRIVPAYVHIPELGWVAGVTYPMARVFRGIPFGKAERFQPPKAARSWDPETLDASKSGPDCMHPVSSDEGKVSEDCLFLNVYSPTWGSDISPVLVWLHGGGYVLGAGSDTSPEDAEELVLSHKMVVVTANYRLGAFGFLGAEQLRSQQDNTTGNWGMQDQALALRWVQKHIGHFGGDASRVTVIGWSAGAASISVHLTVPEERGLFQKAILMSGGFTDWAALSMDDANNAIRNVAACLDCPQSDRKCLERKDAFEVMECSKSEWYGPVVDGVYLKEDPMQAVLAGSDVVDYSVPIIIGCTLEDKLLDIGRHATPAKLRDVVAANVDGPESVDKALHMYPLSIYSQTPDLYPPSWSPSYWAARQMLADRDFTCVMKSVVETWSHKARAPAYWYSWAQPQVFKPQKLARMRGLSDANDRKAAPGSCYPCPGAGHGADLAFLFENPEKVDVARIVRHGSILTDKIQDFDTNFVWSSDPDTDRAPMRANTFDADLPEWHRYDPAQGNAMYFQAGVSRQIEHYREDKCEFWSKHAKTSR
mmetsp:Transcript_51609/g.160104  ORF Transcript_51609/g.160104 Transcript_51609/m.160104 type:complete len:614 (-) Transcript_51609:136-1977(-)